MEMRKIIFICMLMGCIAVVPGPKDLQQLASAVKPSLVMVIDAGHGGPDGGAEAADGTKEKDINLAIAKALQSEAKKQGIKTIMTRETDEGLYERENIEKNWKKLGDLKERKRIIDESKPDLVVSIHLNSFWPDTSVRGAQVFYPKSGDAEIIEVSERLAGAIQDSLINGLNDGSNRIEMSKDDIYLFEHVTVPTVLVECGFLSHHEDLQNLKTAAYQKKVAVGILEGILQTQLHLTP